MEKLKHAIQYFLHDRDQLMDSMVSHFLKWLPDKPYLALRFRYKMGYWMDFDNPKTFNEKLQWLKLYNRKPEYTKMVDKYAVKEYVASIIGDEYIIPTLGVWDRPEDIEWERLPDQFVLKTTHGGGSGGVVICKDKIAFDKVIAINKLKQSMRSDIYRNLREWPYKNVEKRVIAEKYIAPSNVSHSFDLTDYKFYCFDGEPIYCQVIRDRSTKETIDFYDMEWNHQEFVGLTEKCSYGDIPVDKPNHFEDMKRICRNLAKNIPFVRVDQYVVANKVYFGELTFFPNSGLGRFTPLIWETKIGELMSLSVS